MSRFSTKQERKSLERELPLERYARFSDRIKCIVLLIERLWRFLKKMVLYNRYYERLADFKGAILTFFANIKQYRSEFDALMTLTFHTLGTEGFVVFCGATWLRQDCARPAILIHFFKNE